MKASGTKKQRGAYFTPTWLADSLAAWAIRSGADSVIDPAAGNGELLVAAVRRIRALGGNPRSSIYGVELHSKTAQSLRHRLSDEVNASRLIRGDFFQVQRKLGVCDAIIGNPPFVRHQGIPKRMRPMMRSALNGRHEFVGGKASAWAYFLVASTQSLKTGGRLAMVLPSDLLNADYGRLVLNYLRCSFSRVSLTIVDRVDFGAVKQQVIICCAEGYDSSLGALGVVEWSRHRKENALDAISSVADKAVLPTKSATLVRLEAPSELLELERQLANAPAIAPLGSMASVSIGYVSGNKEFFHLTEEERRQRGFPTWDVQRVLCVPSAARGIRFTVADWDRLRDSDLHAWLIHPRSASNAVVRAWIERGRRRSVHQQYKCRTRQPWWRVALQAKPPKAFMICIGPRPAIVDNLAGVRVSNSLFEIAPAPHAVAASLAAASLTSVFRLSCQLNARLLSGGLSKLEPSDASKLLVPLFRDLPGAELLLLDRAARRSQAEATELADQLILRQRLGWTESAIDILQSALRRSALQAIAR